MRPADAHGAGVLAPSGFRVRPADAHDAGGLAPIGPKCAQLMLMMLAA